MLMHTRFVLAGGMLAASIALASAQTAPAPAPAAAPATTQAQNGLAVNEQVQDWTVRCYNVRSPAPCEMVWIGVNEQTKQTLTVISFAYVPERNAYRMQLLVPLGVTFSKGLSLGAGDKQMRAPFSYCTRNGCAVEGAVDTETIAALGRTQPSITIRMYRADKDTVWKISMKGFSEAITRLKALATQRATRSSATPAPAAPRPAPATPAPAPPHPAAPPH